MSEVRCRHDVRLIFCPVCQPSPPAPQPDPKQYPLGSGARAAFERGYAEGAKDSERLEKRIAELERQDDELHARCLEAERQGMSTTLPAGLVARLDKRIAELEAQVREHDTFTNALEILTEQRDAARAECARLAGELDARLIAYKATDALALQFHDERDAARAEVELWKSGEAHALALAHRLEEELTAARAECEKMQREWVPGWVHQRGVESYQRLEAGAARMREALEKIVRYCKHGTECAGESCYIWEHGVAREALASTTAGTSNSRSETAGNEPTLAATPHLINTDISCDQGGDNRPCNTETAADSGTIVPDGGETPGGSDGK